MPISLTRQERHSPITVPEVEPGFRGLNEDPSFVAGSPAEERRSVRSHQPSEVNLVRMDFLPRKIPKANDTRISMGMALDLIKRPPLPERGSSPIGARFKPYPGRRRSLFPFSYLNFLCNKRANSLAGDENTPAPQNRRTCQGSRALNLETRRKAD